MALRLSCAPCRGLRGRSTGRGCGGRTTSWAFRANDQVVYYYYTERANNKASVLSLWRGGPWDLELIAVGFKARNGPTGQSGACLSGGLLLFFLCGRHVFTRGDARRNGSGEPLPCGLSGVSAACFCNLAVLGSRACVHGRHGDIITCDDRSAAGGIDACRASPCPSQVPGVG